KRLGQAVGVINRKGSRRQISRSNRSITFLKDREELRACTPPCTPKGSSGKHSPEEPRRKDLDASLADSRRRMQGEDSQRFTTSQLVRLMRKFVCLLAHDVAKRTPSRVDRKASPCFVSASSWPRYSRSVQSHPRVGQREGRGCT